MLFDFSCITRRASAMPMRDIAMGSVSVRPSVRLPSVTSRYDFERNENSEIWRNGEIGPCGFQRGLQSFHTKFRTIGHREHPLKRDWGG